LRDFLSAGVPLALCPCDGGVLEFCGVFGGRVSSSIRASWAAMRAFCTAIRSFCSVS
jgi:hypothetical protein